MRVATRWWVRELTARQTLAERAHRLSAGGPRPSGQGPLRVNCAFPRFRSPGAGWVAATRSTH
jgi:hypothetical protein